MTDAASLESLMGRYAAGDEAAFSALFEALYPGVMRFHLRSVRNPELAEDLTQRTFLKLHLARRRYRPDASLKPWVFAIAKNLQRDLFRKRARSAELLTDTGSVDDRGADAGRTSDILLRKRLEEAVMNLPENQRDVILLHKFEGLAMNEVAEALGIGLSAAKVRAHRGYAALRDVLEKRLR